MSSIPNTTNLNVRVDSTLKEESDMLFKNLGLNCLFMRIIHIFSIIIV